MKFNYVCVKSAMRYQEVMASVGGRSMSRRWARVDADEVLASRDDMRARGPVSAAG